MLSIEVLSTIFKCLNGRTEEGGREGREEWEKERGRLYNRIKLIIRVLEYNIIKWRI